MNEALANQLVAQTNQDKRIPSSLIGGMQDGASYNQDKFENLVHERPTRDKSNNQNSKLTGKNVDSNFENRK